MRRSVTCVQVADGGSTPRNWLKKARGRVLLQLALLEVVAERKP